MRAVTYGISGLALRSAIALPELEAVGDEADWTFSLTERSFAARSSSWFQQWTLPGGRRSVSFARHRNGYLVRFHGLADFTIDFPQRSIVCARRRHTRISTLRHLLLDQVIPLVLSRDRRLVLHASAVAMPAGAVAFAGPSGSGKSTLAAALAAGGFPLLTDDCLVVEPSCREFVARPFYPGARLWPDSVRAVGRSAAPLLPVAHYTRKRRIAPPHLPYREESVRLAGVFVLDGPPRRRADRQELTVTSLSRREALVAMIACTFHLDLDADTIRRGFELHSRLVTATPVHRLSYPWRLAKLTETRDALVRRLGMRDA